MFQRKIFPLITLCLCLILAAVLNKTEGGVKDTLLRGSSLRSISLEDVYTDSVFMGEMIIAEEAVALSQIPSAEVKIQNSAADAKGGTMGNADSIAQKASAAMVMGAGVPGGIHTRQNGRAVIDYSYTADGYVMVQYTAAADHRLKVQIKGPSTTYTYNLNAQQWTTFPLSDGNGNYQVGVFENVADNRYASVLAAAFPVQLTNEFAPFIRANQYVDYSVAVNTVSAATELTEGITDPLKQVELIYNYVVQNLTYDYDRAASVKSGYLPVLDQVLAEKKGICFDYAALMAGMLRSQGVPCKLVVGYAGTMYHAWISVWTSEHGWVDGVIYFDGSSWHRMDPTFASSAGQSAEIISFIENGANYTVKYIY